MNGLGPLMKAIAALVAILAGLGSYQGGGSTPPGSDDVAALISESSTPSISPAAPALGGTEDSAAIGETNGAASADAGQGKLPKVPAPAPAPVPPSVAAPAPPAAAASPAGRAPSGAGEVEIKQGGGAPVKVTNVAELTAALSAAAPGQTIELADGTYAGQFVLDKPSAAGNPITLKGSKNAIIDGGESKGYTLHMNGANYWQLVGFTVTGGEKGIMTDKTNNSVLSDLTVGNTGAEAVHFGNFSSNNIVQRSTIHDTGGTKPQFGEGLYFGTAKSNWDKKSGGQPDKSDGNQAINNIFKKITAENIDVKEETSGGIISGNQFDASAISGENFADSVLDIKGFNYRIVNNVTTGSSPKLLDGFQTHVITEPATSGCNNTFEGNTFQGVTFNGGQEIAVDKKCGDAATGAAKPAGKSTASGEGAAKEEN